MSEHFSFLFSSNCTFISYNKQQVFSQNIETVNENGCKIKNTQLINKNTENKLKVKGL